MRRLIVTVLVLAAAALVFGACSKKNCEELCGCHNDIANDYYEGADFDEDECVDECRKEYKEDSDCRKAVRELAKCIDDEGCSDAFDDCNNEYEDLYDDCDPDEWIDYNQNFDTGY